MQNKNCSKSCKIVFIIVTKMMELLTGCSYKSFVNGMNAYFLLHNNLNLRAVFDMLNVKSLF